MTEINDSAENRGDRPTAGHLWSAAGNRRQRILNRLMVDVFERRCMDNMLRGVWVEYMVAEALGENCRTVGQAAHAWDLQLGESTACYPERIRIQVKNSARLQMWNAVSGQRSVAQWSIKMRKRPFYFEQYNPGVPCEPFGFLCDVFILCLHPIEDSRTADQSDPDQWEFYVVPVAPTRSIYPLVLSADGPLNQASYTVVPESLRKGIRGRPPIEPVRFHELTEARVRQALGL